VSKQDCFWAKRIDHHLQDCGLSERGHNND